MRNLTINLTDNGWDVVDADTGAHFQSGGKVAKGLDLTTAEAIVSWFGAK